MTDGLLYAVKSLNPELPLRFPPNAVDKFV